MATLESDKVREILTSKLKCEVEKSKRDHDWFVVKDQGQVLATTSMSKGSKETLRDTLVSYMAKQLKLGGAGNFVKLVGCKLSRDECITIIRNVSGVKPPVVPSPAKPTGKVR